MPMHQAMTAILTVPLRTATERRGELEGPMVTRLDRAVRMSQLGITPESSFLYPLTAPESPPERGLAPGRMRGLGRVQLGLLKVGPEDIPAPVAIGAGVIVAGLTGLAAWSSFASLARQPSTFLKIGLVVGGIATGLGFLQSLLLIVMGVTAAVAGVPLRVSQNI